MVLLFHNDRGKFQENKIWNRSDNRFVDKARTWLRGDILGECTTKKKDNHSDMYQ